MAKILLAWELGANAGYAHPLGVIALELKNRGHTVLVGVKNIAAGERYLASLGIDVIQAPIWNRCINHCVHSAVNYAELLMLSGYLDIEQVAGQIRSWINIIKMFEPNMILANHSPGVLLAARVLGIHAAQMGTGFCIPPLLQHMPSMQPWAKISRERFVSSEERVLRIINQALQRCEGEILGDLSHIFDIPCYLNTFPETDHYGMRENVRYWGVIQSSYSAEEPYWPKQEGPRVYVYMQSDASPYKALMKSLVNLGWPTLVVSRGINDKEEGLLNADNISFSPTLVKLESVAEQADVIITNCNHGTTVELLRRGGKLLVIPLQVEQTMLAHRLSEHGLVIFALPNLSDYSELIREVHDSTELDVNVSEFHRNYGNTKPQYQLTALVDDIESRL